MAKPKMKPEDIIGLMNSYSSKVQVASCYQREVWLVQPSLIPVVYWMDFVIGAPCTVQHISQKVRASGRMNDDDMLQCVVVIKS